MTAAGQHVVLEPFSPADAAAVGDQLGRTPRAVAGVAHRCPCGNPAVLATEPRLPDGTPFPTTYYLTCPRATAAVSRLESDGRMAEMTERLAEDADLAAAHRAAHRAYLADRASYGHGPSAEVPEIDDISAGGMPDRVKCLHALAAHALAAGPGVNPFGDEAVTEIGAFWQQPCLPGQRVAVIDCGTNTIRLLIAADDGRGGLTEVDRRMEIVRLGQGVDATGAFHPDALARTWAATERYAELIAEAGVVRTRFIATSAARDAGNREEFFAGVQQRLGVSPEVISGEEEARLSYAGALSGATRSGSGPAAPVLVADIGGGSTELIIGDADRVEHAVSIDVGSVRLTERFWTDDPPTAADLAAAGAYVDRLLDEQSCPWSQVRTWIGVAGTLTTLAAVDLDLMTYDRSRVHAHPIGLGALSATADRLAGLSTEQIRTIAVIPDKRADVITAGALIATRIARRLQVPELIVSETDILDGAAADLMATPPDPP